MTTFDWLKTLIAFDTTSRNSNLSLIECLSNAFEDHQIKPLLIHAPKEPKANLFATLPSKKGETQGGIILSGHTDVVPVDGQHWDTDPFVASLINDRIYARGSCDMKGFIAVVMAKIPELKARKLDFPVHFAFSYDEEIGCLGAPYIIDKLSELNVQAKACIVGEPTSMLPVVGHKGKRSYRCQIHGVAAHSSLTHLGCNAIEHAAAFIGYLRDLAEHFKSSGHQDHCYDVPFTTITTNLIKGGNSYNTIPSLCEFIFEFRNLAVDDPVALNHKIDNYVVQELLPRLKQDHKDVDIILDTIANAPGLEINQTENLVKAAQSVCKNDQILKVAYATEAGMFQQAKIPTILCGPGSIEQAHRANEYVSLEQIKRCEDFISEIIDEPLLLKDSSA